MFVFAFLFVFVFVCFLFVFVFFYFCGVHKCLQPCKKEKSNNYTLTVILCKMLREKGRVIPPVLTFTIVKLVGKFLRFPACKYCSILDFVPEPLPRFLSLVTEGWAGPHLKTRLGLEYTCRKSYFCTLTFSLLHLPASSDQAGSSAAELAAGKALQQLWAQFREIAG